MCNVLCLVFVGCWRLLLDVCCGVDCCSMCCGLWFVVCLRLFACCVLFDVWCLFFCVWWYGLSVLVVRCLAFVV